MYTIHLLGTTWLEGPDGPLGGRVAQRHQLALLALLATAPHHTLSRDKLLAYLWPEVDNDRARHRLNVAVHEVRRALGEGAIVSVVDDLRLNADVVTSDVAEFETAVRAGELERAVELYGGPFLDGFHLKRAPEFEEWVGQKRERLRERYAEALQQLAEGAEARADGSGAVKWWRALVAHEPYQAHAVRGVVNALVAVDDRTGALEAARTYARRAKQELGLEPDADVMALAERLCHEVPGPVDRSVDVPAMPAASRSTPPRNRADLGLPGRHPGHLALFGLAAVIAATGLLLTLGSDGVPPTPTQPAYDRTAIAVLPFENLSTEAQHAYFAPGLHDELITQLAKVAALKVISRTSVMGYEETKPQISRIARELEVGSIVEGTVQVVGERLRVHVQLIDAATDANLWAERYDRTLDDAFAIQSDVAQRIVRAVGAALGSGEQQALAAAPTANPEAYRFYLHGRDYFTRPGRLKQNWAMAEQLYERALALDPNFALALAALAEINAWTYFVRYDPSPSRLVRAREEAEAALRLAPDLPQARIAMGVWHYWGRCDYERALEEFAIALEGSPNDAWLWQLIGAVHRRLGNWDSVFAAYERATQLDPRDADLIWDLGGNTYSRLGRYAEAVRAYDRALSLVPDMQHAAISKGWVYILWRGELDTLRAVLDRLPEATHVRLQLLLLQRNADGLLQFLRTTRMGAETQQFFQPSALYAGWAHQLRGDGRSARAAFDSARVLLDSVIRELPDDWRVHVARGLALAGLGRRDDAVREARWIRQSVVYREDASEGPFVAIQRALILAQAGEADMAVDELERVRAGPHAVSAHMLRLDPLWDPIRDHPRFQGLLANETAY